MESASTISWTSCDGDSMRNRITTAKPKRYERHKSAKQTDRKQDPAASTGKSDACRLLIEAGSDPNAFESPSEHKDRHESNGLVPFIPQHGKHESWLRVHSSVGGSALHRAVESGNIRTVQRLISLNSNVNSRDRNGLTPLMLASMKRGNRNMVHLLTLIPGGDIRAHDRINKNTALHYAAHCGDASIVRLLLENGAHVEETDAKQNTPLIAALTPSTYDDPKWPVKQTTECVKLLLENGSYVNTCNADNKTPIYFAVTADLPEIVWLLLQKSAVVPEEVLRKACILVRNEDIVDMLLQSSHTFSDEFLSVLLVVVISTMESKWTFNARQQETTTHNIAKSIIKAVSDPDTYVKICTLTTQELTSYLGVEITNTINLQELGTYGLFGYALLKGKLSIARMLFEAGSVHQISRLKSKTEFYKAANEHPYLKTWLPEVMSKFHSNEKQENEDDNLNVLFLTNLDLDKAFDAIEPYDDVLHESGYGMLDVNFTARENSKAYLATNVLIYS